VLLGFIKRISLTVGLFHRGIAMSGSAFWDGYYERSVLSFAKRQAALLNCPADSSQQIKDCLMKKEAQEIASSLSEFIVSTISKYCLAYLSE
jgi:carboxylesterase type B